MTIIFGVVYYLVYIILGLKTFKCEKNIQTFNGEIALHSQMHSSTHTNLPSQLGADCR